MLHGSGPKGRSYDKQYMFVSLSPYNFSRQACRLYNCAFLEGESGAHNTYVVDEGTYRRLVGCCNQNWHGVAEPALDPQTPCLYAVGGQFRGPGHRSGQKPGYGGIWLYAISESPTGAWATRVLKLVDGAHHGCIELRQKCADYGEFDGQSSLIFWPKINKFVLFTRANRAPIPPGGHRGVQAVAGSPQEGRWDFDAFTQLVFEGVPPEANIYFAHPYVVNNELVLIMP
jgi:hypothetical protein